MTMRRDTASKRRNGPALEAMHLFIQWASPTIEKFPRSYKFTLGERMVAISLDTLEHLIVATYDRDRAGPLQTANLGVEKLRHLFRIAFSLKCLDERRYEHAARQLDEIGRLIGGWKKASEPKCSPDRRAETPE